MGSALVCPACAASHPPSERFCSRCGMPLVMEGAEPTPESEQRDRARKIQSGYAEGELVKVGWAPNQPEAELMAGLLLEEGIPTVLRRARGFDVPDFLAAGPRDILVAASAAEAARELLGRPSGSPQPGRPSVRGVALALLVIVAVSLAVAVAASLLS